MNLQGFIVVFLTFTVGSGMIGVGISILISAWQTFRDSSLYFIMRLHIKGIEHQNYDHRVIKYGFDYYFNKRVVVVSAHNFIGRFDPETMVPYGTNFLSTTKYHKTYAFVYDSHTNNLEVLKEAYVAYMAEKQVLGSTDAENTKE